MKKINSFVVLCILLLVVLISCKKDDETDIAVDFILAPENVYLNDFDTAVLYLSTKPAREVKWQAAGYPEWIELQPSSGTINSDIEEIIIISHISGLNQGYHFGNIEIISNSAGKGVSMIELVVGANPIGSVSPTNLEFATDIDTLNIEIENTGIGYLEWEVTSTEDWLNFEPSSGTVPNDNIRTIQCIVDRSNKEIGDYVADIVIQSNSVSQIPDISASMYVPELASIGFSIDTLDFGFFHNELFFEVINTGNISYDWELSITEGYLSSGLSSGHLNPAESVQVTISADRDGLDPNQYLSSIQFSNNKGVEVGLPVVLSKYNEEKWLFDGRVIDAEFDRAHNVIIAVTENPYSLLKLDPETESIEEIQLNLLPWSVSINPEGTHAVVGHDANVTYVDLLSMTTIEVFSVSEKAFDIVLAPNNFAYIFPSSGQWTDILCLNLDNGNTSPSSGFSLRHRTKAKLHPSGNYIYGADTDSSPSDFEKYDIRDGIADYMYDSPYHGDFSFGGNIWISDDGNRLIARSRNVFISTTNQNTDMTYNGQLLGDSYLVTADHSSAANRIFTIEQSENYYDSYPTNEVKIYEAEFLNYIDSILLPGFLVPDDNGEATVHDSEGHFGFFNNSGSKFYVLVKAREGSNLLNDWAVATIDVN